MDMFSRFLEGLRPKCDHMTIQELEESLKMRWDATNKLQKDLASYGEYAKNLREELAGVKYAAELDSKYYHKEMAKLEGEILKKAADYEEMLNKYNELLNKIDTFHEALFTKKIEVIEEKPKKKTSRPIPNK